MYVRFEEDKTNLTIAHRQAVLSFYFARGRIWVYGGMTGADQKDFEQ